MLIQRLFLVLIVATLAACGSVGSSPVVPYVAAAQSAGSEADYQLGPSDKIRVNVFDEEALSGDFTVNAAGAISLPLIGAVPAAGRTVAELSQDVQSRLAAGYLRDPKVNIEVTGFRPFFILGEVNKPGEYPYSVGLTVQNAVATAEGFTYRADTRRVFIKRFGENLEREASLGDLVRVSPGDTIRIRERYF